MSTLLADSPFAHLLGNNDALTDAEVLLIRAHIAPHLDELSNLEALIGNLTAQRDLLKEYVDAHVSTLSPIRRLPPDIIQEIFLACLPTHRNAIMSPVEAPLLLGQVCSGWRNLSLSFPALWTSLHIQMNFVLARPQRVAAAANWLARSATCPLSVSVSALRSVPIPDSYLELMEILIGSASRWRHIHLKYIPDASLNMLEDIESPMLESIRVEAQGIPRAITELFKAPGISRVWLDIPDKGAFTKTIPVDWNHLTHLKLINEDLFGRVASTSDTFSIIKRCPALISLQFQLGRTGDGPALASAIHLLHLRSLTIESNFIGHTAALHDVSKHLHLPSLHTLSLPETMLPETDDMFLEPFFTRSPKLERLSASLASFTIPSILAALQAFPALRELNLGDRQPDWDIPDPTLAYASLVALLPRLPELCPLLETLLVKDAHLGEDVVHEFARKWAQSNSAARLQRRVDVQFNRSAPVSIPHLQTFESPELKMALRYYEPPWKNFTPLEGADEFLS